MKSTGKKSAPYTEQGDMDEVLSVRGSGVRVRSAFDRERIVTVVDGVSKTIQSFRDECDINTIMSRYMKTGILDHVNRYQGSYEDVTDSFDYRDSIDRVRAAEAAFGSLPAAMRKRFDDDPATFLDFVADPANRDAMMEMGLIPKPPAIAEGAPKSAVPEEPGK